MKHKRKHILLLTMALIFLTGLGLALYPAINGAFLHQKQRQQVISFSAAHVFSPEAASPALVGDQGPLDILWADAAQYNQQIFEQHQALLSSAAAYEQSVLHLADYGLEEEVFAVISIPALELEMPVYLGASTENLSLGAAHMGQTSLPIGGENTNCVIAGHRGWKGAAFFKMLPSLKAGDPVTVTNLWSELHYQVVETQTISSDQSDAIMIQPGRDLLTLLTCDYGADGVKKRYLVICERVAEV